MTKEENPQTKNGDFPLSWKAQTPRFPHSHRMTTTAALASTPKQSHSSGCATHYLPDLPTDSSEEAKKELFYVAASRGRSEIAVVTSDREQLRDSVGVSTTRQSAIELARKQLSPHNVEKGHGIDVTTGMNRQVGQQIGEQHSSVPTHMPEPERTPQVGLDHDLGGLGLGLGH